MDSTLFGRRLKEARLAWDLRQSDLAQEIGVSPTTITRYESGQVANVNKAKLDTLANRLRVNPEWLSGESDEKYTIKTTYDETEPVYLTDDERDLIDFIREIPACAKNVKKAMKFFKRIYPIFLDIDENSAE